MIIKAFAKINLSLDVTGKREDGYHTLRSVMQSVSLCDEISLEPAKSGVELTCSDAALCGDRNLAYLAAERYFKAAGSYGVFGGCRIHIEKRIPSAGGLGGGSADAAAVLVGLDRMYEGVPSGALQDLALSLGADVPFCLTGGTALAEGIGEKLALLRNFPSCFIVIAKKGTKKSTGDMYARLDRLAQMKRPDTGKVLNGIKSGSLETAAEGMYNCFEQVCGREEIGEARSVMTECGAVYCGPSGAGPSVFGIFKGRHEAEAAAGRLRPRDFETFLCVPKARGNEIIE